MPHRQSAPDRRWNFAAALVDAAGWPAGMALISATTILPLFVRQLTPSPIAAGLIQAAMLAGWLVPGILVAGWVERQPRVKPSVMALAALERAMLLLMFLACLAPGPLNPPLLLAAFFACWTVMNAAVGANTPGYFKLIAKTVPSELRGRLYGVGGAVAGLLGIAAAWPAGWLLTHWGFPRGYSACFLAAFIIQTVSVLPLAGMREPVQAPETAPAPAPPWRLLQIAREDHRLAWICGVGALFSVNLAANGFYTLYAVHRFGASEADVAGFTAVVMAARTTGALAMGWIGDRRGNRAALRLAAAAGIGAAALAAGAPDVSWLYAVLALGEIALQGWGVCSMNYVLELCPAERSSSYTAVFGLLSGPFRALLPLAAGVAVQAAGYPALFGAALAGSAAAMGLLLVRLPEPREQAAGWHALPARAPAAPLEPAGEP